MLATISDAFRVVVVRAFHNSELYPTRSASQLKLQQDAARTAYHEGYDAFVERKTALGTDTDFSELFNMTELGFDICKRYEDDIRLGDGVEQLRIESMYTSRFDNAGKYKYCIQNCMDLARLYSTSELRAFLHYMLRGIPWLGLKDDRLQAVDHIQEFVVKYCKSLCTASLPDIIKKQLATFCPNLDIFVALRQSEVLDGVRKVKSAMAPAMTPEVLAVADLLEESNVVGGAFLRGGGPGAVECHLRSKLVVLEATNWGATLAAVGFKYHQLGMEVTTQTSFTLACKLKIGDVIIAVVLPDEAGSSVDLGAMSSQDLYDFGTKMRPKIKGFTSLKSRGERQQAIESAFKRKRLNLTAGAHDDADALTYRRHSLTGKTRAAFAVAGGAGGVAVPSVSMVHVLRSAGIPTVLKNSMVAYIRYHRPGFPVRTIDQGEAEYRAKRVRTQRTATRKKGRSATATGNDPGATGGAPPPGTFTASRSIIGTNTHVP